jgi:hypothetical protein
MARELPPQCPGAVHHMMGCGDRRERVFLDDAELCLFAPRGLASGWGCGPENRPIGRLPMNTDTQNGELLGTGPFRGMTIPIPNREIITDGDITLDPACGILLVMSRNPKKVSIVRTDTCSPFSTKTNQTMG